MEVGEALIRAGSMTITLAGSGSWAKISNGRYTAIGHKSFGQGRANLAAAVHDFRCETFISNDRPDVLMAQSVVLHERL